jgi:hypothetical protein
MFVHCLYACEVARGPGIWARCDVRVCFPRGGELPQAPSTEVCMAGALQGQTPIKVDKDLCAGWTAQVHQSHSMFVASALGS